MSHPFWHPFADMALVAGRELVIVSGHGSTVVAEDGREFLDATAGLWFCSVGHGRDELAEAAARQMRAIASYSNFGDLATRSTLDLAERLAGLAPMADAKVFFTSGGSDAVDTAVKLARRYWSLLGQPDRSVIVTRNRSYHGMHLAGTSLAGIDANREGHGPLDPQVAHVAWDDPADLVARLDGLGPERVAAFFCEPVIGAGGVYLPPPGYLEAVRQACRERDVLFIADEVITGYGRTGRMFASEGLEPDLVLTAKGLTSGYLPMGAVLVAGRVAEPFWAGGVWRHGYTYSGHASAAAVALANLDIIDREGLVRRVADAQLTLTAALAPLRAHDWVAQVRTGAGLLGAVQLEPALLAEDPAALGRVVSGLRERGVITRPLVDGSLQVSPPFVTTRVELHRIGAAMDEALSAAGSLRGVKADPLTDLLPDITSDEAGGFGSTDARLRADVPPHHGS
ncbi:MAG: aminotransferase class III-fold pyridoxal phosphate-dependent enzyme [Actinomycetota bacterium]|nr:aminotransferase class III-fold pyridoxal phosphate-dependent enzyme [Actinomycetota bacterium]